MCENSAVIHLTCGQFIHCPSLLLFAVSATDEREDQYQLLQVQNKRRLIHHSEKPMVRFHEPLDQRGGAHCLYQHSGHIRKTFPLQLKK